jgi:hypothetical protein
MADPDAVDHRHRAHRAQGLSDLAREQAGAERAAAERSERLIDETTDPALADIHRQAAALHRQAVQQYERAADFQREHAAHEGRAAEDADRIEGPGTDRSARDGAADRRDGVADERERLADFRERDADAREQAADERETLQDDRQRVFDDASGRWTPRQREHLARAKATARRIGDMLARRAEELDRADAREGRDNATIVRETDATNRDQPSSERPPTDLTA